MSSFMKSAALAALVTLPTIFTAQAQEKFSFVAMGDVPYGKPDKVYGPFKSLIAAVNAKRPAFTLHIGDIKSGSTPCSDEMLMDQFNFMNTLDGAVLYTPGDNEWTDCHRKKAGKFDPLARLEFLRQTFFQGKSLGRNAIPLERQSDLMPDYGTYVENARFARAGIQVIVAHVVGSNNNLEARDPAAAAEFFARDKANRAWLGDSFDKAIRENAKAIVLGVHADMFRYDFNLGGKEKFLRHSGFKNFAELLVAKAKAFGKPVLLIYGDTHQFMVTRPFIKTAPNITALQVFGSKEMHAVEVMVDPESDTVFAIKPLLNPALVKN